MKGVLCVGEMPPLDVRDARYIVPPLAASGVAGLASEVSPFDVYTGAIYALEGDLVAVFQSFTHPVLTQAFIAIYLLAYPILLLGTYIGLKPEGRHADYALTYTAVVVASTPVFFFVPVGVTGYTIPGVEPLLYEDTGALEVFMTNVDTLQKALPSLHAGLAVTASLYAPRGYERVSWTVTGLILLSTLYLGIHWLVDLAAGAGLAYACYLATPAIKAHLQSFRRSTPTAAAGGD
jgi:membrane-associated phospholipid phosphatase